MMDSPADRYFVAVSKSQCREILGSKMAAARSLTAGTDLPPFQGQGRAVPDLDNKRGEKRLGVEPERRVLMLWSFDGCTSQALRTWNWLEM